MSYFEWLKNLSHVRFGRMGKRFEQRAYDGILKIVERETGRSLTQQERETVARGADEQDLVYSGLEETMISSYHYTREILLNNPKVDNLRTAAFVNAIDKVALCYHELGVFP